MRATAPFCAGAARPTRAATLRRREGTRHNGRRRIRTRMSLSSPVERSPVKRYANHVDGEWRQSEAERTVANVNPAETHEVLGQVPLSTAEEARAAVDAAQRAFAAWRDTPAPL